MGRHTALPALAIGLMTLSSALAMSQGGTGRESTSAPPKKTTTKTTPAKRSRPKSRSPQPSSVTENTNSSANNSPDGSPKVTVRYVNRPVVTATTGSLAVAAESGANLLIEPINIAGAVAMTGVVPEGERIFIFNNLKPGDYRVAGTLTGYSPVEARVTIERNRTKSLTLNFQPASGGAGASEVTGGLEGQVVDGVTNSPVAGATVQFINKDSGVPTAVRADSQGRFRKGFLPPGEYTIRISKPGYVTYEGQQSVWVAVMKTVIPLPIKLNPE